MFEILVMLHIHSIHGLHATDTDTVSLQNILIQDGFKVGVCIPSPGFYPSSCHITKLSVPKFQHGYKV